MKICSVPDCGKPVNARGWCAGHYHRWERHGDPLSGGTSYGAPMKFFTETVLHYTGDECLIWPFCNGGKKGYAKMSIKGKVREIHPILCEKLNGPRPSSNHDSAHSCGNRRCVSMHHLSWKTRSENLADRLIHGTHNRGERNPANKLTKDDVLAIRALDNTVPQSEIARRFGIHQSHVCLIQNGKTWAWLK